jgi:ketosteroid isomerase-like protein
MRRGTAALVLSVALGIAGCGGDDDGGSDEDKIRSTIDDYASAVRDSDQPRACELLTDEVKAKIEEREGKQCQSFVTNLGSFGADEQLTSVEATDVSVDGNKATATVKGAGEIEIEVDLIKDGADWKITDPDDADLGLEAN